MKTLVLNGNTRRWFAFLSDLLRLIMILAATNGHTLSGYAVDRARTGSEYIFAMYETVSDRDRVSENLL